MAKQSSQISKRPSPSSRGSEWDSLIDEVVIDRQSAIPPVEQIENFIRHRLATGRVQVGSRMPSARKLAAAVGVTPATVGRAYATLQAESLLTSVTGVGTTVASVADLGLVARQQMQRQAISTLGDAVRSFRSSGMSTTDIRVALHEVLEGLSEVISAVAVGARGSSIDSHVTQLRGGLKDLPVEITMVVLEDLVDGESAAVRAFEAADLVLTPLVYRRHVSRLLGPEHATEVVVLMSEIAPAVTERLLTIEEDARLLLVSKPLSRSIALGILQSHGLRDHLSTALDLESGELASQISESDIVIHTTDLTELISQISPGARTIPLRLVLRQESISSLRDYIKHATGTATA